MNKDHNLAERFARYDDEYDFSKVTNPLHRLPDVCAFLLLEKLAPGKWEIVSAAEHDQIWLATDCCALDVAATDKDIITLSRCGVFYDEDVDGLSMHV